MKTLNIKLSRCLALLLILITAGCVSNQTSQRNTHEIVYQLEFPDAGEAIPSVRIDFCTEGSATGWSLSRAKPWVNEGKVYCERSDLLHHFGNTFAIIVTPAGQPSSVFILKLPKRYKPSDWSQWLDPNFDIEDSSYDFRFVHGDMNPRDKLDPSIDSVHMRYRIQEWQ